MVNFSLTSLFFLTMTFFILPIHLNPASLGVSILLIAIFILTYFISINITLIAILTILVYIRGILILFSYFFSLIQNTKIFFIPLLISLVFVSRILLIYFSNSISRIYRRTFSTLISNVTNSFSWVLYDIKLVIFLVLILLLSILFIEKVIGLKQKPLRVK
jgi:hypothetical protein